jgi:hypothetical protein
VSIQDDAGSPVAYGVIVDISGSGACVWNDAALAVGTTLSFRISFAQPPEVHEVIGVVVWNEETSASERRASARCGVEWLGASHACRKRLRELAGRAVEPAEAEDYPFQVRWKVAPTRDA